MEKKKKCSSLVSPPKPLIWRRDEKEIQGCVVSGSQEVYSLAVLDVKIQEKAAGQWGGGRHGNWGTALCI